MTQRSRVVVAVAALAAVVLLGALLSLWGGALFVMASDPCTPESSALICSSRGQSLVFFLPVAGWAVAVAATSLGVARVLRGRGGMWRPLAGGVAVFVVTLLIGLGIATRPVT